MADIARKQVVKDAKYLVALCGAFAMRDTAATYAAAVFRGDRTEEELVLIIAEARVQAERVLNFLGSMD